MLMAFFSIVYNEALRAYGTRPLHLVFSQNMRHQNIFSLLFSLNLQIVSHCGISERKVFGTQSLYVVEKTGCGPVNPPTFCKDRRIFCEGNAKSVHTDDSVITQDLLFA